MFYIQFAIQCISIQIGHGQVPNCVAEVNWAEHIKQSVKSKHIKWSQRPGIVQNLLSSFASPIQT